MVAVVAAAARVRRRAALLLALVALLAAPASPAQPGPLPGPGLSPPGSLESSISRRVDERCGR